MFVANCGAGNLQDPKQDLARLDKGGIVERQRTLLASLNATDAGNTTLLLKALSDPNSYVRYSAAWALEHQQFQASEISNIVEAMLRMVNDEDMWVRMQAIKMLSITEEKRRGTGIPDESVRKILLRLATDPNPYIRAESMQTLRLWKEQPDVKDALKKAFTDEVSLVRYASSWAGYHERETWIEGLRDEDATIRLHSIPPLGRYPAYDNDPKIRTVLIERLRDPDGQVVYEALMRLAQLREQRALRPILNLLNIGRQDLVRRAITEMRGSSEGSLADLIRQYEWKPDLAYKQDAPIRRRRHDDVSRLIQQTDQGSSLERLSAVLQLMWVETPESINAVLKTLKDQDARVRYASIDVLHTWIRRRKDIANTVFPHLLTAALQDPNPHVRRYALQALDILLSWPNSIVSEESKNRLGELATNLLSSDKDPFLRTAAVELLLRLARPMPDTYVARYAPVFEQLLDDEFYEVREKAVLGINFLFSPGSLDRLVQHLTDPFWRVRMAAANQLVRDENRSISLAHPELIRVLHKITEQELNEYVQRAAAHSLRILSSQE